MNTVTLFSSENRIKTISDTRTQISDIVRVSSRVSHTHCDLSRINSSESSSLIANGRRRRRQSGFTGSLSRRFVVVTREQSVDDGALNELMDQRKDGSTSDTFIDNVQRGIKDVTNTRLDARAVEKVGNGVCAFFVTVCLSANVGRGHTGASLLSGNQAVVCWSGRYA